MKFKNHLASIKATLMDYPTMEHLDTYIPEFVALTWLEKIEDLDAFMKDRGLTRRGLVMEMFENRTLPTALETVRLTFFLEGLDLTNVTHIIRHRMFSFSAQSTDPVSMAEHDILENDAFTGEFQRRARQLANDANELYRDALEAGFSFYDARHYQLRAKEAKYFMSGNIKEFIAFINVRLGRTNQPTSDNILAAYMRKEILKVYPFLDYMMPPEKIQWHYLNAMNHKMNMNTYPPDARHRSEMVKIPDVTFSHPIPRDEYPHMDNFNKIFKELTE